MNLFTSAEKKKAIERLKEAQRAQALQAVRRRLGAMREYMTIHLIDVARICPSPLKEDDLSREKVEKMADSIRKYGLLQPLSVRRISAEDSSLGGLFVLLAGRKRLEALKMLGIGKIPCVIVEIPAAKALAACASDRICTDGCSVFDENEWIESLSGENVLSREEAARQLSLTSLEESRLRNLQKLEISDVSLAKSAFLPGETILRIAELASSYERRKTLAAAVSLLTSIGKSERTSRARRKMLFTDWTPLRNSVENLVSTLRKAGVPASWDRKDESFYTEFTIRIEKPAYRLERVDRASVGEQTSFDFDETNATGSGVSADETSFHNLSVSEKASDFLSGARVEPESNDVREKRKRGKKWSSVTGSVKTASIHGEEQPEE